MTIIIKSSSACTDTSLPFDERDEYLSGVNAGDAHVFDIARKWSYPKQSSPVHGDLVRDLSRSPSDAQIVINGASAVGFEGGGLDFPNTISNVNNGVVFPNSAIAPLVAEQEFMFVVYVKLPTLAQWFTHTGARTLCLVGDTSTSNAVNTNENHLAQIMLSYDPAQLQRISIRRQTAAGANYETLYVPTAGVPFGELAQLSCWRKDGVFHGRVRSASLDGAPSTAAPSLNPVTLTGQTLGFGRVSYYTASPALSPYRIYRGLVENLHATERDPVAVLNADWERVVARGVYS